MIDLISNPGDGGRWVRNTPMYKLWLDQPPVVNLYLTVIANGQNAEVGKELGVRGGSGRRVSGDRQAFQ